MSKFRFTLDKVLISIVIGLGLVASLAMFGPVGSFDHTLNHWTERVGGIGSAIMESEKEAAVLVQQILMDPAFLDPGQERGHAPDEALRRLVAEHAAKVGATRVAGLALLTRSGAHQLIPVDPDAPLAQLLDVQDSDIEDTLFSSHGGYALQGGRLYMASPPGFRSAASVEGIQVIMDLGPILEHLESALGTHLQLTHTGGSYVLKAPEQALEGARITQTIKTSAPVLAAQIPLALFAKSVKISYLHMAFMVGAILIISVLIALYTLHRLVLIPLHRLKDQLRRRQLPGSTAAARKKVIAGIPHSLAALGEIYETLQALAITDPLTGLYNRILFEDRVKQLVADNRREPRRAGILLIDMNRFKQVNDTLGHPVGDELLRQVAQRISHSLRESDTLARLGGDEFAVLLPGVQEQDLHTVAEKLHRAIGADFRIHGHTLNASLSIGASLYPDHAADAGSLMQFADIALYEAKKTKGQFAIYREATEHAHHQERTAVKALSQAISQGDLSLCYQPVLSATTRKVEYLEALVRCPHPDLAGLSVEGLIALAERNGLIRSLTNWVLEHACRQIAAWRKERPTIKVGVNISVLDLKDPGLTFVLRRTLERHQLPASALILEIAEVAIMQDTSRIAANLKRLSDCGLSLAIDDFGTGQTSLRHLRHLPIHLIKIDKSFVTNMARDPEDEEIVRATIELAHGMEIAVCAEGVTSQESYDALIDLGCNSLQGYFISRPLDPAQVIPWLQNEAQRFLAHTNLELSL